MLSTFHVHPRSCFCSILRLHKRSKKALEVETFGTYLDETSHTREVYPVVLSTWVQTCDSMWQFTGFYKSYKYIVNKHKFKYFTHANSNRWLEVFPKTSLACEDVTSPRPIPHVDFPLCHMYQGPSPGRTSYSTCCTCFYLQVVFRTTFRTDIETNLTHDHSSSPQIAWTLWLELAFSGSLWASAMVLWFWFSRFLG